ncbi:MAG: DEAD/DEAH box helicase [Armatimonadetes bacterium]|nr:DEAD/DEAH box helicase [Armatimonadota bacterium]
MSNSNSPIAPARKHGSGGSRNKFRNYGSSKQGSNNRFSSHQERGGLQPKPRTDEPKVVAVDFLRLGISEGLAARLGANSILHPTPIQEMAIPAALTGDDLIGLAQTGTGKTLAFGLPMLMTLAGNQQGLVLAPTRELAMQIDETFRKLGVRTALLIGGAPMPKQISQLRGNPRVIVATPGRMQDHLNQRTADLRDVQTVVLDEADRMLDMGFVAAIRAILGKVPKGRQTMLFSATFPRSVEDISKDFMTDPTRVEIPRDTLTADTVTQELIVVEKDDKPEILTKLLKDNDGSILVFARTRHGARKIAKSINRQGHSAAEIHSDRTLAQRVTALNGFKSGEYRVLVATDIAARGIDVKNISLVINYDIPEHADDYVHRIGRTGRAGKKGHSITIATPEQHRDVRDIERLIKMKLDSSNLSQASLPEWQPKPQTPAKKRKFRPGGNRGGKAFAAKR